MNNSKISDFMVSPCHDKLESLWRAGERHVDAVADVEDFLAIPSKGVYGVKIHDCEYHRCSCD